MIIYENFVSFNIFLEAAWKTLVTPIIVEGVTSDFFVLEGNVSLWRGRQVATEAPTQQLLFLLALHCLRGAA